MIKTVLTKKMSFLTLIAVASLFSISAHAVTTNPHVIAPNEQQTTPLTLINNSDPKVLQSAKNFVDSMTQEGIGFLSNPDLTNEQRSVKFKKFLKKNFDMNAIGRFSLGRYWKTATKAQRNEYLKLFEARIIKVYTKRFGEYKGESLATNGAKAEGKYDVLVTSLISPTSGSKIRLDWRVRKKNGHFKVIDVIVEGVSMALTQRSDFSSVIQRGGGNIEVLLEHLR